MNYLGNNFWDYSDDKVFNTKTQCFYDKKDLPATMRYERSMGEFEVVEGNPPTDEGHRFVIMGIVEGFFESKSGKSRYAKFNGFSVLDKGLMKVENRWLNFDEQFELNKTYLLAIKVLDEKRYQLLSKKQLGL